MPLLTRRTVPASRYALVIFASDLGHGHAVPGVTRDLSLLSIGGGGTTLRKARLGASFPTPPLSLALLTRTAAPYFATHPYPIETQGFVDGGFIHTGLFQMAT